MQRSIVVSLILAVSACGPFIPVMDLRKVPPETMQAALQVEVALIGFTNPSPQERYLGQVQGNSCKNLMTDPPPSTNDAILRMRVEAVRLGANAVIDVACDDGGTDAWGTNCWASVTCKGTAVRLRSTPMPATR